MTTTTARKPRAIGLPCMRAGCAFRVKARGLCWYHHRELQNLVNARSVTWSELTALGLAKPTSQRCPDCKKPTRPQRHSHSSGLCTRCIQKHTCRVCKKVIRDRIKGQHCWACVMLLDIAAYWRDANLTPPPADQLEGLLSHYETRATAGLPLFEV